MSDEGGVRRDIDDVTMHAKCEAMKDKYMGHARALCECHDHSVAVARFARRAHCCLSQSKHLQGVMRTATQSACAFARSGILTIQLARFPQSDVIHELKRCTRYYYCQ